MRLLHPRVSTAKPASTAAAGGQGERAAPDVPAVPRQVHVGAGFDQHPQDRRAAPAADRVVQAAVGIDVDAAIEEPLQPADVLEVELVIDQLLVPGRLERVEQLGVRVLACVVEGVLVAGGATLEEQSHECDVVALDGIEQRRLPALAAPLDGVAVRVGTGVEQQSRARANLHARAGRPSQQGQQRR